MEGGGGPKQNAAAQSILNRLEARAKKVDDLQERMTAPIKGMNIGTDPEGERILEVRNPTVRLERHLMARTLDLLHKEMLETHARMEAPGYRTEAGTQMNLSRELRDRFDVMKLEFDELNRQMITKNHTTNISIDTQETGKHTMPIIELDLHPPKEGVKDERIPWICIGGIAASNEQNSALWMSMAQAGERVFILEYPEKYQDKPKDWKTKIWRDPKGALRPYETIFSNVISSLAQQKGIEQANFIGHSAGGEIVINMAAQEKPPVEINNLIAVEPVGFEKKNIVRNAIDFAGRQNAITSSSTEDTIKVFKQGENSTPIGISDWLRVGRLTGQEVITPKTLNNVKVNGRFQILTGDSGPVVDINEVRSTVALSTRKPEFFQVHGADHVFLVTHGIGFSSFLLNELRGEKRVGFQKVNVADMETSAAAIVLKQAAAPSKAST